MKHFKSIILLLLLVTIPASVFAEKGEKTFGVKTGYISRNESILAGIYFQYTFNEHFRIAPDAEIAFRHKDRDAIMIDLDCHFPFAFTDGGKVSLYPLAGINFSSWNRHLPPAISEIDKDVTTRSRYFGLNCGAGIDLKCSPTLKLSFEARYSLVKANSNAQISLGIGYTF